MSLNFRGEDDKCVLVDAMCKGIRSKRVQLNTTYTPTNTNVVISVSIILYKKAYR